MSDNFWGKAFTAPQTSPEPEPEQISPEDVDLSDWGARRGELGIPDSSDFIGVSAWKRPTRYVHHEQTELEQYAAQRAELGVREAPQSSVGNPRRYAHPYGTEMHTIREQ